MDNGISINIEKYQRLLADFKSISSFGDVHEWSGRAEEEIEQLTSIIRGLDVEIARDSQILEKLKYEASKKMLGRLFGASSEEKELANRLEDYRHTKSELMKASHQLKDFIDFTPKSPEERESLLKELRKRKKELQEKKREITQVVRGPRLDKSKDEPMDTVFDRAAIERRKARYAREAELLEGETTSQSLSRQIAQVERDIEWVEKFN